MQMPSLTNRCNTSLWRTLRTEDLVPSLSKALNSISNRLLFSLRCTALNPDHSLTIRNRVFKGRCPQFSNSLPNRTPMCKWFLWTKLFCLCLRASLRSPNMWGPTKARLAYRALSLFITCRILSCLGIRIPRPSTISLQSRPSSPPQPTNSSSSNSLLPKHLIILNKCHILSQRSSIAKDTPLSSRCHTVPRTISYRP